MLNESQLIQKFSDAVDQLHGYAVPAKGQSWHVYSGVTAHKLWQSAHRTAKPLMKIFGVAVVDNTDRVEAALSAIAAKSEDQKTKERLGIYQQNKSKFIDEKDSTEPNLVNEEASEVSMIAPDQYSSPMDTWFGEDLDISPT